MNAPIKPSLDATRALQIAHAVAHHEAMGRYVVALKANHGRENTWVQRERLVAINTALAMWPDNDLAYERDEICAELGVDAEGYPVDAAEAAAGRRADEADFRYDLARDERMMREMGW